MLKIGILCGGQSIEREVSLNSGRTVYDHLDTERFCAVPLFQTAAGTLYLLPVQFLHRGKTVDFEHRLCQQAQIVTWDELPSLIDFAFIAMHGRYAEDGSLQGMLEVLGIPYFGTGVLGSALGMDKVIQKKFLQHAGIEVPRGMVIMPGDYSAVAIDALVYPCIVKPAHEGSSLGVAVVRTSTELDAAVQVAARVTPGVVQPVIVEEQLGGMEFTCILIADRTTGRPVPLSVTEIVCEGATQLFTYDQKYMPGRALKCTPARCTPEQQLAIQETCIRAMLALHMTQFARIDGFLLPDGRVIIIDANSLGGMAPSSFAFLQAAEQNMSHTDLINHLLCTGLQASGMLSVSPALSTHREKKVMRVAVLMGGVSSEREISLESGRNVVYKLSPHKYEAVPLFLDAHMQLYNIDQKQLVKNSTREIQETLRPEQRVRWNELSDRADFVFIALHGGLGENGAVQGALELLRMPYNGSGIATSALCMDKYLTAQFLKKEGFAVPCQLLLARSQECCATAVASFMEEYGLSFPLIVKPCDDGCSALVQRVLNMDEVQSAVHAIFMQQKAHVLIEECVQGMELTVGVLGNEDAYALPPSQAVATHGILSIEEKFLPGAGENQTPAHLASDTLLFVQRTMVNVYKALGCRGYARIDCFYQSARESVTGAERVIILECNSLPGLTPATCLFHQAAEVAMKPMELIDQIIHYGLCAHTHAPSQSEKRIQRLHGLQSCLE